MSTMEVDATREPIRARRKLLKGATLITCAAIRFRASQSSAWNLPDRALPICHSGTIEARRDGGVAYSNGVHAESGTTQCRRFICVGIATR